MAEFKFEVDPQLRAEFIDESMDGLSSLAELFVELESDPSNTEIVESIFRVAHSIKGNAAYFELMKTKALAHEMETLLDLVRKGRLMPGRAIIDILLEGVDALTTMLERARSGEAEIADEPAFQNLVERVVAAAKGESENKESHWENLISMVEASSDYGLILEKIKALAEHYPEGQKVLGVEPGKDGELTDVNLAEVVLPRPAAALKELLDGAEDDEVFDNERAGQVAEFFKQLPDCIEGDKAKGLLGEAQSNFELCFETIGVDVVLREIINDCLNAISGVGGWVGGKPAEETPTEKSTEAQPEAEEKAETSSDGKAGKAAAETSKTMRVTEESIDAFLSYVGDLVVIGEMYNNLVERMPGDETGRAISGDLKRVNESFDGLSNDLQRSIMEIRKMPLRSIMQRAPRIVRDVAKDSGKEIETILKGESIAVDKSIVDTLEAPLVHMVRNSADHGIELPDAREAADKPRQGRVEIVASETGDNVYLTVTDDGKGIDREALRQKAVSMGLVDEGAEVTDEAIIELLFMSGVSTAEKVTDVSGRGVGMDVVKRNIESVGGAITVKTEPGLGSTFTVRMPKTVSTQILTGFIVVVDNKRYVISMERILRCFRPEASQIKSIEDRGECVVHNGQLLSVIRFRAICGTDYGSLKSLLDGILVVVQCQGTEFAIHVDSIEDVRQVVLKTVDGLEDTEIFQGGAVMGDGSVGMILDVDRFVEIGLNTSLSSRADIPAGGNGNSPGAIEVDAETVAAAVAAGTMRDERPEDEKEPGE
jgi:two-component system, chemotaxis family, sensor kinase CheA